MKIKLILALCLFTVTAFAQTPGHQDAIKVPGASWMNGSIQYVTTDNALLYLPWDYGISNKMYPLIVFDHGVGEKGTDINKVRNQGLPKVIDNGTPPYSVKSGDTTWFIVLSMQNGSWSPTEDQNVSAINYLIKEGVRIDQDRMYITGLSAGGQNSANTLADRGDLFSAGVSMSPASALTDARIDSFYNKYIWYFQGTSDGTVSPNNAYSNVEKINNKFPGHARLTKYAGGHCCWTTYYNPSWKENGQSIYDWLLQYSKIDTTPPVEKPTPPLEQPAKFVQPNAVIAGSTKEPGGSGEIIITLPVNSVTLDASRSTGTIDKFQWGVLGSSPNQKATISGQGTSKATFSNLTEGKYIFYVNVSANAGGWPSSSLMNVIVQKADTPPAPPTIKSVTVTYSDGSTATITSVGSVTVEMKDGTIKQIK